MSIVAETLSSAKVIFRDLVPLAVRMAKPPAPDVVDNLPMRLAKTASECPNKNAIIFEGRSITWGELDQRVSQVAQALRERGVTFGDTVSLMMDNRIEFIENMFGIMRAGAAVSLINTNLHGAQLVHCVTTTNAKAFVVGSEHADTVGEVKADCNLEEGKDFLVVADKVADKDAAPTPNWAVDFSQVTGDTLPIAEENIVPVRQQDPALYIFTSGTTGLPKAAIQKQGRQTLFCELGKRVGWKLKRDDTLYICLPLYHATGLCIGFLGAMEVGASVVLKRKFSASQFLNDVREHRCNAFIYIGELCRYLLSQPVKADDGNNPIEKMTGNGLRPDIWMEFKERFQIPGIYEFYGASEGNATFMNFFNRDKTIGAAIMPPSLVQYDVANDEIVRDANGFCKKVEPGEPGLLLGPITAATEFVGYTDREATEKKILRDVFKKGDAYFNTGDLIKMVDAGFALGLKHYQFVDRVGDTFRWKGENCSTNEVGEIINGHEDIEVCNVYGVEVPGTDGRAGMAALLLKEGATFDPTSVSELVQKDLASYARPVFIRILPEQQLTGTFKLQKGDLREAAYHPDKVTDDIYVWKPGGSGYEKLDVEFYEKVMASEAGY
ncbi:MAG: long-chain-acyl-CoA synthetase [Pseudomonadales bacterium]|nr:long-chain-acyl-CoA synthetase [Pseudomonadales bacterium]MBO6564759.1 long-chain-acyl-CoA synthetase [Pseudomonadales bacterium]MBO6597910.1 long-chain-acyl-CoA synthetase [Pseudomonadales bacterium]MBO6658448.1 long-chain-acyl-CoA synthetase [Pseudomonadales bacterium]MBO6702269.1 long-chain-acyl-CoA synthetase [Pseudomonadales bacterium]